MFEKLARFRHVQPQRMALPLHATAHSNDNLSGFRRPQGSRRIPPPALACHWSLIDGMLTCHWRVESLGGTTADEPDQPVGRVRPQSLAA